MPEPDHVSRTEGEDEAEVPQVTARSLSEDRTVFTEADNPDGWIATDLTLPLEE